MDYRQKIGQNIRKVRHKLGWTIEDLAEKVELSSNFVGNIERGQGTASVHTLIKLMRALGCNANDIFEGVIEGIDWSDAETTIFIRNLKSEMSLLTEEQQKSVYEIFKIYRDDVKKYNKLI